MTSWMIAANSAATLPAVADYIQHSYLFSYIRKRVSKQTSKKMKKFLNIHIRKKSILLVLFCYVFTSVLWGVPYAQTVYANEGYQQMVLPTHGYIEDHYITDSSSFIAIIQDAHSNYAAQKNEISLIKYLIEEKGFQKMYLEGAVGPLDTTFFKHYPYDDLLVNVCERSLKENRISAADYIGISSHSPISFYGIETEKAYVRNMQAAETIKRKRKQFEKHIAHQEKLLYLKQTQVFNSELFEFYREYTLLISVLENEEQTQEVIDHLLEFIGLVHMYKKRYSICVDDYPYLQKIYTFTQKGEVLHSINVALLLDDIHTIARKMLDSLIRTHEEQSYYYGVECLRLLKKGINLMLREEEVKLLFEYISYLETHALFASSETVQEAIESVEKFYTCVSHRDTQMKNNLLNFVEEHKTRRGIVVIGGYHAQTLKDALRNAGISFVSIRPYAQGIDTIKTTYWQQLQYSPFVSTMALPSALQDFRRFERIINELYEEHNNKYGFITPRQFKTLIKGYMQNVRLQKRESLYKMIDSIIIYDDYQSFESAQKCLMVKQDLHQALDLFEGNELHIVAAGGGGDLKGALLLAYQMASLLKRKGKKIERVKLITSNLKRGEENPFGGPTPMKNIMYEDHSGLMQIQPIEGCQHLYALKRDDYFARARIYDENSLLAVATGFEIDRFAAEKNTLKLDTDEVIYNQPLFENGLVALFREKEHFLSDVIENIEILIADCEKNGEVLAEDYAHFIKGREESIMTIGVDMGGDILARYPKPIENYDATHSEYNVRSPNTDTIFLDMLTAVEAKRPDNTFLAVSAIGGDGELGPVLFDYLRDLHTHGEIIGILDHVRFFRNDDLHPDILQERLMSVPSEVSNNLLNWIAYAQEKKRRSFFDKYPPDYIGGPLLNALDGINIFLRDGSRVATKMPQYLTTLFMRPHVIKERIATDYLRENSGDWYEIDAFIRREMNYLTEMNDPNNIYSRLKTNMNLLTHVFLEKDNNEYKISSSIVEKSLKSSFLIPQLAALIALSKRFPDQRQHYEEQLCRSIRYHGDTNFKELKNPLLLALQIYALSHIGVYSRETRIALYSRIVFPLENMKTVYRGFDYWVIRNETLRALQMKVYPFNKESEELFYSIRNKWDDPVSFYNHLIKTYRSLDSKKRLYLWRDATLKIYNELMARTKLVSLEDGRVSGFHTMATLYQAMSMMFFVVVEENNNTYENAIPKDIDDYIDRLQFKEAAERIMDLYSNTQIDNAGVYRRGHIIFGSLAEMCYAQNNVFNQTTFGERKFFNLLLREAAKRPFSWPIPKVSAGIMLDDEFVMGVNDIGVDEHGELKMIFNVLEHAMNKLSDRDPVKRIIKDTLTELKEKAKVRKLNNKRVDIEQLIAISSILGSPLSGKTVYVVLRPCAACIEKLSCLGVREIVYMYEHAREQFREKGKTFEKGILVRRSDLQIEIPDTTLLKQFEYLCTVPEWDALQAHIRRLYFAAYSQGEEMIMRFRKKLDHITGQVGAHMDLAGLIHEIEQAFNTKHEPMFIPLTQKIGANLEKREILVRSAA